MHRLTAHDARSLNFHTAHLNTDEVTLTVNRLTNCVDNATENTIS